MKILNHCTSCEVNSYILTCSTLWTGKNIFIKHNNKRITHECEYTIHLFFIKTAFSLYVNIIIILRSVKSMIHIKFKIKITANNSSVVQ